MSFSSKCKQLLGKIIPTRSGTSMEDQEDITKRIDRLERNYIILLKRVLEIDGVQFVSKHAAFTSKVMTTRDELSKGLNEPEPTIH